MFMFSLSEIEEIPWISGTSLCLLKFKTEIGVLSNLEQN